MHRLPRAERRSQLIEVATAKFGEKGFHPTSMDDIADAAGITKPVLYQHFSSKEDLYIEVIASIGARLKTCIDSLEHSNASTAVRIDRGIDTLFSLMHEQPSTLRLFFGNEFITEKVQEKVTSVVHEVAETIGAVLTHTRNIDERSALIIGHAFTAAAQATARQALRTHDMAPIARDTLCQLLAHGLTSFTSHTSSDTNAPAPLRHEAIH